jgi:hypothetical protein
LELAVLVAGVHGSCLLLGAQVIHHQQLHLKVIMAATVVQAQVAPVRIIHLLVVVEVAHLRLAVTQLALKAVTGELVQHHPFQEFL